MNARTHDIFAFASLLTATVISPPQEINILTFAGAITANIVGALIPDMDQAGNRLWDLLPAGDSLGRIFRRVFYKHRTISHSLLGLFIISNILQFLLPRILNPLHINHEVIYASMMIGYVSHLIADGLTKEGLPLFFPFKFSVGFPPFRFLRITTGSWVENYLFLPTVGVFIIYLVNSNRDSFLEILKNLRYS